MRSMAVLAAAMLVGLVAGCTGDDAAPEEAVVTPTPTPTPTEVEVAHWPLTGLPAPDGVAEQPVMVVKVDNTRLARPQLGLAAADLIVEEPVEGGSTRLAAMYHSQAAAVVVPVRSIRTTDLGVVDPISGVLVASGGAQRVLRMMDGAGVTVITGGAGFDRESSRSAPYNVTVDLEAAWTAVADHAPPEIPYLEWAEDGDERPDGQAAAAAEIVFSSVHTTAWDWDAADEVWLRRDDLADPDDAFTPDNVLALHVVTQDAGYADPGGNPVHEVVFDEPGDALLLTGGVAVEGEWEADGETAAFVLTDDRGDALAVPPGQTWIALVPEQGAVITAG